MKKIKSWSFQNADVSPIESIGGELDRRVRREYRMSEGELFLCCRILGRSGRYFL